MTSGYTSPVTHHDPRITRSNRTTNNNLSHQGSIPPAHILILSLLTGPSILCLPTWTSFPFVFQDPFEYPSHKLCLNVPFIPSIPKGLIDFNCNSGHPIHPQSVDWYSVFFPPSLPPPLLSEFVGLLSIPTPPSVLNPVVCLSYVIFLMFLDPYLPRILRKPFLFDILIRFRDLRSKNFGTTHSRT